MYHGNFLNGLMHGDGHLWSADGTDLNGTWATNKLTSGNGSLRHANGDLCTGRFIGDKIYGDGSLLNDRGTDLTGTWDEGGFTGRGSVYNPEGDLYIGDFVDSARCGQGRREYPNGTVYEGLWGNGGRSFVGEVRFANGDIFTGSCKDSDDYRNQSDLPGSRWSLCIVLGEGEMRYKESGAAVSCKWSWGCCEEWARPRVN
jgi:hypothetical protein